MAHKIQNDEEVWRQRQQEQCLEEVGWLVANWPQLGTLERGEGVVSVLGYGISTRRLAKIIGCGEGTSRNYEIIGLLTEPYKQGLLEGRYSARQILALVRRRQKREANSKQ